MSETTPLWEYMFAGEKENTSDVRNMFAFTIPSKVSENIKDIILISKQQLGTPHEDELVFRITDREILHFFTQLMESRDLRDGISKFKSALELKASLKDLKVRIPSEGIITIKVVVNSRGKGKVLFRGRCESMPEENTFINKIILPLFCDVITRNETITNIRHAFLSILQAAIPVSQILINQSESLPNDGNLVIPQYMFLSALRTIETEVKSLFYNITQSHHYMLKCCLSGKRKIINDAIHFLDSAKGSVPKFLNKEFQKFITNYGYSLVEEYDEISLTQLFMIWIITTFCVIYVALDLFKKIFRDHNQITRSNEGER